MSPTCYSPLRSSWSLPPLLPTLVFLVQLLVVVGVLPMSSILLAPSSSTILVIHGMMWLQQWGSLVGLSTITSNVLDCLQPVQSMQTLQTTSSMRWLLRSRSCIPLLVPPLYMVISSHVASMFPLPVSRKACRGLTLWVCLFGMSCLLFYLKFADI